MFQKSKSAVLVALLVFSAPGFSFLTLAEIIKNGEYNTYGTVSCGEWVKYRAENNSELNEWWIGGYLTAYNRLTPETIDILGNTDLESVYLWVDKWCHENPLKNLADAMVYLTVELYPNRTITKPDN